MKLFFETAGQAQRFLIMVPLGFALALCLDADAWTGRLRAAADCLFLLLCGWLMLCTICVLRENSLRIYHMLGLLTGAILYLLGVGRIVRTIRRRIFLRRQEKERHM